MSDTPQAAKMEVRQARAGISWIWLVPFLALAVSLFVAWQNYSQRGTLIEVIFANAEGVKAGETVLKFRDVEVGTVEDVTLTDDFLDVMVSIRIDNKVAPFLDNNAEFWIVRPDVSLRGVTGLETVLSGVFIEGSWDGNAGAQQYTFFGSDTPPLSTLDALGTSFTLLTKDGGALTAGAPILHRGIKVGYLEAPELTVDGPGVQVNGFVEFPHDRNLTTATRFWDTSGFSISLGTSGVELDVNSLASLIEGGVAFDTVVSGGQPVARGHVFDLFPDEDTARESVFTNPNTPVIEVAARFDGSVSGLNKGSEVRFRGIRIGRVSDLNAVIDGTGSDAMVQLQVILQIETGRLGLPDDATEETSLEFLSEYVSRGLKARLSTANILSGSLVVELLEDTETAPGLLDPTQVPYPIIPTAASAIADVAETAEDVLERIEGLPIEDLMQGAIDLMASIERLTNDSDTRGIPANLTALLDDARELVGSEDVKSITPNLLATISDLDLLVQSFGEAGLAEELVETLSAATLAANNIASGTENLPQVSAQLEALVTKANALELAALVTEATETLNRIDTLVASEAVSGLPTSLETTLAEGRNLLTEARGFVASEDVQALPTDLRATVNSLNVVISEIENAGLAEQLASAITSATAAAQSVEAATSGLPDVVEQLNGLATTANSLDLAGLVGEATETLAAIDTLLSAEGVDELPHSLASAIDEVRGVLSDLRAGGAVDNLNLALTSANDAAQAIETAVADLPDLAARANALVRQTQAVVDSYSERSRFGAETLSTLRDIQDAADAISSLARTIQRNPSSLLTGR